MHCQGETTVPLLKQGRGRRVAAKQAWHLCVRPLPCLQVISRYCDTALPVSCLTVRLTDWLIVCLTHSLSCLFAEQSRIHLSSTRTWQLHNKTSTHVCNESKPYNPVLFLFTWSSWYWKALQVWHQQYWQLLWQMHNKTQDSVLKLWLPSSSHHYLPVCE